MKKCSYCNTALPFSEFSKDQSASDGKMRLCKKCNKKKSAKYYENKFGSKEERKKKSKEILEYVSKLRFEGRTLKDIGNEIGVSESTVSYYLSGKRNPGSATAKKLKAKKEKES